MKRTTTRVAGALCAAAALTGLCAFFALRAPEPPPSGTEEDIPAALRERVRIVLITEFSAGAHASQYLEGARSEAAA